MIPVLLRPRITESALVVPREGRGPAPLGQLTRLDPAASVEMHHVEDRRQLELRRKDGGELEVPPALVAQELLVELAEGRVLEVRDLDLVVKLDHLVADRVPVEEDVEVLVRLTSQKVLLPHLLIRELNCLRLVLSEFLVKLTGF